MSDWKTMVTAPTDVAVKVGRWSLYMNKMEWRQEIGVVWEARLFGLPRKRYRVNRDYTHWDYLPNPPKSDEDQA